MTSYPSSTPEFVAVILAGTVGTRLFPLTGSNTGSGSSIPKHLLPLCGISMLQRMIRTLHVAGLGQVVVALAADDGITVTALRQEQSTDWQDVIPSRATPTTPNVTSETGSLSRTENDPAVAAVAAATAYTTFAFGRTVTLCYKSTMQVTFVPLPEDCAGTMEAIRSIETAAAAVPATTTATTTHTNDTIHPSTLTESTSTTTWSGIPRSSHLLILPSDLIVMDAAVLMQAMHMHRLAHGPSAHHGASIRASTLNGINSLPTRDAATTLSGNAGAATNNITFWTAATSTPTPTAPPACTIILANVGEQDDHGIPLKESAKQKKGGLAREEEEVEYIGLAYPSHHHIPRHLNRDHSYPHYYDDENGARAGAEFDAAGSSILSNPLTAPPRVVFKQAKVDVEEDKYMDGSTPKLIVPKPRLRHVSGITRVRTDWHDLHVYIISAWVRPLIQARHLLLSLHGDLIPLLVSRQFQGVVATYGNKGSGPYKDYLEQSLQQFPSTGLSTMASTRNMDDAGTAPTTATTTTTTTTTTPMRITNHGTYSTSTAVGVVGVGVPPSSSSSNSTSSIAARWLSISSWEYSVLAHVVPGKIAFRAHSIPAYLYASKEFLQQAIAQNQQQQQQGGDGGGSNASGNVSRGRPAATSTTTTVMSMPHPGPFAPRPCFWLPTDALLQERQGSLLRSDTVIANDKKVQLKYAIVTGRNVQIGAQARLNHVIVMDHVVIGDQCVLQNTVLAPYVVLGDACHLNDCQVGPYRHVATHSHEKGEMLVVDESQITVSGVRSTMPTTAAMDSATPRSIQMS